MELCRAWGKVRDQEVLVFFDLHFTRVGIQVGNPCRGDGMIGEAGLACPGHSEAITPILGKLRLHIQSYVDAEEFHSMPLQNCDVLLGIPWCSRLHAVVDTFHKKITLEEEDEEVEQEDGEQEKGGLSESGLELKKLLGKSAGLDDSADDESSDDDNDLDNEDSSPVLAPKRKEGPKEEPLDTTPVKPSTAASGRTSPASAVVGKGKRKAGTEDSKPSPSASSKKVKTESQEAGNPITETRAKSPPRPSGGPSRAKGSPQGTGAVTEDDVKAVLKQGPIKSHDLVNKFKSRLATREDKSAFAAVLKNISRIHKTDAGNFIVLREK
ncbi:hypothetical protein L7F22_058024 [Adiantum nelumboides]|nr:hypothetical protein [Adiantum nelumboides]